jgi:DNA (cytosine-5)-methyltransferase 1
MRVLDLFSGIGGFSFGLERAGMQTVAFCEIDPFCRQVLAKHWPGVPIHEDIRALDGRTVAADVVCGGFPCQPFSTAGKRRGKEDDRHLWPEMRRVIAEARPAWVIGENVPGIIRMELDAVLSDLEALGYACRTFVVPAAAVDAPHIRARVWVVARDANRDGESVSAVHAEASRLSCDVADANQPRSQGHGRLRERAGEFSSRKVGRAEPRTWLPEPAVGRVAHGIPRRVDRLRALGNAVVPQIPEMIGRAILEAA